MQAEARFLAIGDGAGLWLAEAAVGRLPGAAKMAQAVQLAALPGAGAASQAVVPAAAGLSFTVDATARRPD